MPSQVDSRQVRRAAERAGRKQAGLAAAKNSERLVAAALVRNGVTYSRGFKSHSDIRRALGDADPYRGQLGDFEGFLTSEGRFVGRQEAKRIGVESGQLTPAWVNVQRDLLSSDILWEAR